MFRSAKKDVMVFCGFLLKYQLANNFSFSGFVVMGLHCLVRVSSKLSVSLGADRRIARSQVVTMNDDDHIGDIGLQSYNVSNDSNSIP